MIYITGDCHGNFDFDKLFFFSLMHPELKKTDYVIVCGDFGGVWGKENEEILNKYSRLPFTTLWVDGNHENYGLLKKYPVKNWQSGKVQFIRQDVIHLMRGQVFLIEGKSFFTLGGAESHDKEYRVPDVSWWQEEIPSQAELQEAERNLNRVGWKVNYVVTHSCDSYCLFVLPIPANRREERAENRMLCRFEEKLQYDHWYFGHYHADGNINGKKTLLYQQIIPIGEKVEF